MAWDSKSNLYIATGDNNSSRFSDGYSGNNPQPNFKGVSFADARRTAGNTNNLNGKILRIHPEDDGTYTLPEGNLFTGKETDEGGGKTRGEIYVMGVRNPARISIDKKTDTLYAGWVGPDAGAPSDDLGPGQVRHLRRDHQGGQPRLAVLHGQQAALPRPQPARPDQAAGLVRLRRTRRTSRRTTTAWSTSRRSPATTSGTRRRAAAPTTRATRTASPATSWRSRSCSCRGSRAAARPR